MFKLVELKKAIRQMADLVQQKLYNNWGFGADKQPHSPQQPRCGSTGKQPAIPNCI